MFYKKYFNQTINLKYYYLVSQMYGKDRRGTSAFKPSSVSYGSRNGSSYHDDYQFTQTQKQKNSQKQSLLSDQHYSNNMCMMALSTLESADKMCKNQDLSSKSKVYGHYDKFDFSHKNKQELKSQLQTQLYVMR